MAPKKGKKAESEKTKEEAPAEEVPAEEAAAEEAPAEEEPAEEEEEEEVVYEMKDNKKTEEEVKEDDADEKEETVEENGVGEETPEETKEPEKKKSKKKKTKKTAEESDGESSDAEQPSALYDGPPEVLESKRERRSRDFFTFKKPEDEGKEKEEEPDYTKGSGIKLKNIPYVKYQISGEDEEDLLVLYKLMYRKQPRYINGVRTKIYNFAGYPFDTSSKFYKSHQSIADKLYLAGVRYINELLGLERKNKSKEEMIADLLEFLLEPKDLGLEVPKPTPKAKKSTTKYRSKRISQRIKGHKQKKVYVDAEESESDSEEEDEEEDSEEEEESEEEEVDDGRRKSRRTPNKKAPAKAKTSNKRKSYPSDDSSDDEVLVKVKKGKKAPAKPPTNAELKKVISSLLKDADLGEVTMKKILHQVYDKYSDFDLASRKDFLKKTVKECL